MAAKTFDDLYRGKRILFIGATGFLGSVTLSLLLQLLPELGRLDILVRKIPGLKADQRFYERVFPGVAFDPVRERFGADLDRLMAEKVRIVQGDLSQDLLGLDEETLSRLENDLDLILNCSGLVDFHAPLDQAYRVNILGTRNLIAAAQRTGAVLVHTSTCFVAGSKDGYVPEKLEIGYFPRRHEADFLTFDPLKELADIETELELVKAQSQTLQAQARFTEQAIAKFRDVNHCDPTESQLGNAVKRAQRDHMNAELVEAGKRRATFWGWPNVYTYSKSIAEQLLSQSGVRFTVVRPAIIESALQYPVTGWNQNATTSAPLVMLALGGFGMAPASRDLALDIVPVDQVAWGLIAASAATLAGENETVYQIGTSDANPCSMDRLVELIGLYIHEQAIKDHKGLKRFWQANREPFVVDSPSFRMRVQALEFATDYLIKKSESWLESVSHKRVRSWLTSVRDKASDMVGDLEKARALWDMFMPFSHDYAYRFETRRIRALAEAIDGSALPVSFAPQEIDWRDYWLDVHIPGLKKWVLTEGFGGKAVKPLPAVVSLADKVAGVVRSDRYRQAIAYLVGDRPFALTYGELWDAAGHLAIALEAKNPQGPIAVVTDMAEPWAIALVAAMRAGRSVLLVCPRAADAAWEHGATVRLSLQGRSRCRRETLDGSPETIALPNTEPTGVPAGKHADVSFLAEVGGAWLLDRPLDARALGERLIQLGELVDLTDRDRVMLPVPDQDGRDADALALVLIASLYHQAQLDVLAARDWEEGLSPLASTLVAMAGDAWKVAPTQVGFGALQRVARVLDMAPVESTGHLDTFLNAGTHVHQVLSNLATSAFLARREVAEADDTDKPFLAIKPWQLKVEGDRLLATAATHEPWQETGWAMKAQGDGFRLIGTALSGPHGRLRHTILQSRLLRTVDLLPETAGEGLRALVTPDLDEVDSLQQLRRHLLADVWRHNSEASLSERITAVGVTLDRQEEAEHGLWWLNTRHKPRLDEEPDLDELLAADVTVFRDQFSRTAFTFYLDHLKADKLTFERLVTWERVLLQALREGDMTAQGFLQTFEQEHARTQRPEYRAARKLGAMVRKVQEWAEDENPEKPLLPAPVNEAVRKGLSRAIMGLYRYGLDVTIRGEAYLPVSENFIVVANHSSHLDGGLVKYALGPWGDRVYTLAAKDYFFGTPARRFFAHHFTRLIPTDRQKVTSDWLRRSRDVLANGECVLIFPEGTRTATPELQPFKASLGTLVRTSQAPVLPIFIEGTWDILPKGSAIPKGRKVTVHLGPLMSWEYLSEKTKELGTLQQDRAIAQLVQDAVDGLKDGQIGWLEAPKKSEPVEPAHHEHPHP